MPLANTAFYAKNLSNWARTLRLLLSGAVVMAAFVTLAAPASWLVASSALGFAVTGLIGFCPACAVVSRLGKQ